MEVRQIQPRPCYLIIRAEKAKPRDLLRFLFLSSSGGEFLEASGDLVDPSLADHRWVIVVSVIVRRIIGALAKPMEWGGMAVELLLNLLSNNGGTITNLIIKAIKGTLVVPSRGSDTFISAIGQLDSRMDIYKEKSLELNKENGDPLQAGSRGLMDLCMMASKLSYENANVVKNVVTHHWKMHFVEFYNCWNDYQKDRSTQVFILCDKPKDADLVLISFRGTEPFDADDWITDWDYSWYEIPEVGKIHMGFLEALGLGNRAQANSFSIHLQSGDMFGEMTAYYSVRTKLKSLLGDHPKAKFVVTGHSLGGALAILFPVVLLIHKEDDLMKRMLRVYTFGQPRVGDRRLQRYMEAQICHQEQKYFRVVYCNDLVPRLPYDNNTFLYKHFGLCLYYDNFYTLQRMKEEPNKNYFGMRYLLSEYINAVWELIRSLIMGHMYGPEYKESWFSIMLRTLGLLMPGLSAHSPTNYINCIRLGGWELAM